MTRRNNTDCYEFATGYPPYTTAFAPSRGCRVFCDTGLPVPSRKVRTPSDITQRMSKRIEQAGEWRYGNLLTNPTEHREMMEPEREITPEESRANYKDWLRAGCIPRHPNALPGKNYCPDCFASWDNCICHRKRMLRASGGRGSRASPGASSASPQRRHRGASASAAPPVLGYYTITDRNQREGVGAHGGNP